MKERLGKREWIESARTRLFEEKFGNERYGEPMTHWIVIKKSFRNIRLGDI
jgi:hypothetical protein